jgi:hypothetical protein
MPDFSDCQRMDVSSVKSKYHSQKVPEELPEEIRVGLEKIVTIYAKLCLKPL